MLAIIVYWQRFVKSRGRRSVVYRVTKDRSKPHVSGFAISSAYQYTSFDERCVVKDSSSAQQVHYGSANELYDAICRAQAVVDRSEEHTSELQSLMRISYAVFCLKTKKHK